MINKYIKLLIMSRKGIVVNSSNMNIKTTVNDISYTLLPDSELIIPINSMTELTYYENIKYKILYVEDEEELTNNNSLSAIYSDGINTNVLNCKDFLIILTRNICV